MKIEEWLLILVIEMSHKNKEIIYHFFHSFSDYDCHVFLKHLIVKKNYNVKFDVIPTANEENINNTYDV